jgi:hypothetical protein
VHANSHDDDQAIVDMSNPTRTTSEVSPRQSRRPGKPAPGIALTRIGQKSGGVTNMPKEEEKAPTYIDEMFAITIAKRN